MSVDNRGGRRIQREETSQVYFQGTDEELNGPAHIEMHFDPGATFVQETETKHWEVFAPAFIRLEGSVPHKEGTEEPVIRPAGVRRAARVQLRERI